MTLASDWVKETREGAAFAVRVIPRASRTKVSGLMGEWGLRGGRCVGASAVPVFSDHQQYASASGLETLN